jgi:hypothetical protein
VGVWGVNRSRKYKTKNQKEQKKKDKKKRKEQKMRIQKSKTQSLPQGYRSFHSLPWEPISL